MADPSDDMLREAARSRGFRLVRSRRRKAGGDFGRYGLIDLNSGRECMGFGPGGLTATAEEVRAYLRGGEVASWKRSLIGVVAAEEPKKPKSKTAKAGARSVDLPQRSRASPSSKEDQKEQRTTPSPSGKRQRRVDDGDNPPSSGAGGAGRGPSLPQAPIVREATRRDAAAIARLLGIPAATLTDRLAAAIRADEPPLVAEQDGLIGIAATATIPMLQDGAQGRITLLLVAEGHRRQGLGGLLLAEAERRLRDAGIDRAELATEIDFDVPTAFLRRTGYTRTTNGYGKHLADQD